MTQQHTVHCPPPSSGSITCPIDHLGICRVVNGQAHASCVAISAALASGPLGLLQVWLYENITEKPASSYGFLDSVELQILLDGRYHDPGRNMQVTFRLPVFKDRGSGGGNNPDDNDRQGGEAIAFDERSVLAELSNN